MKKKVLTLEAFQRIPNGIEFAKGESFDGEGGLNMFGSNGNLKWIAKKVDGKPVVYFHYAKFSWNYVRTRGEDLFTWAKLEAIAELLNCEMDVVFLGEKEETN